MSAPSPKLNLPEDFLPDEPLSAWRTLPAFKMPGSKTNSAAKGKGIAKTPSQQRQPRGTQLPTPSTGTASPFFPVSSNPEVETPSTTRRSTRLSGRTRPVYDWSVLEESEAGPSTEREAPLEDGDTYEPKQDVSSEKDACCDEEASDVLGDGPDVLEHDHRDEDEDYEDDEDDEDDDNDEEFDIIDDEYLPLDLDEDEEPLYETNDDEPKSDDDDDDDDEPIVSQILRKRLRATQGAPSHSSKRVRLSELSAKDWLAKYDQEHPVAEDDADLLNFQEGWRKLTTRTCDWAREGITPEWFKLPRKEKQMTSGYRSMLSRVSPVELAEKIFARMPRQAQKNLGKKDLQAEDLLDLPSVPANLRARGVYVNVATRLSGDDIEIQSSSLRPRCFAKTLKAGVDPEHMDIHDIGVYFGSSLSLDGIVGRLKEHEAAANKPCDKDYGHYAYTSQPDVLPNFRVVFVTDHPSLSEEGPDQDIERWISHYVEGMLITYVRNYAKENVPVGMSSELFPPASFVLNEELRQDLPLPDLSTSSLNLAWPLVQGVNGGMVRVEACSNPGCCKPKAGWGYTKPTKRLRLLNGDAFGGRYCGGCLKTFQTQGIWRTREGFANGLFPLEGKMDNINEAWFAAGSPRQCHNNACGAHISEDKPLFGFMNGIRCGRCDRFRREHNMEWNNVIGEDEDSAPDGVLPRGRNTHLRCASLGCKSPLFFFQDSITNMIEDTEMQVWRCIPCDWAWSLYRINFSRALSRDHCTEYLLRGPIFHHRHNYTHCVDCGHYATPREWTWVEGAGYKCDLCAGKRTTSTILEGLSSSGTRVCKNPACDRTDVNWVNWHGCRCDRCHRVWVRTGEEWVEPEARDECSNPSCDNNRDNSNPKELLRGPDGKTRCSKCRTHFRKYGTEWTPPPPRPDFCENAACGAGGHQIRNDDGRTALTETRSPPETHGGNVRVPHVTGTATTTTGSEYVLTINFGARGANIISILTHWSGQSSLSSDTLSLLEVLTHIPPTSDIMGTFERSYRDDFT
ncbi:unnamed protein product [Fusarium equiseti]|uniref:Uncharacterized protein n=1 Tax=Fusarium equiseti TaxID=61235 RepID=A0A8J2IWT2_FUSEQ|nr:unnamed protein product [Fusarium equiseti]